MNVSLFHKNFPTKPKNIWFDERSEGVSWTMLDPNL